MKTKNLILWLLPLTLFLSGCVGPYYRNKPAYDAGKWRGWADNREIRERDHDQFASATEQLALEKLRATPMQTLTTNGVALGFRGCVINRNPYREASIIINGPEEKGYYLAPGATKSNEYLLPGDYTATFYDQSGRRRGHPRTFHVPRIVNVLGEEFNWEAIYPFP